MSVSGTTVTSMWRKTNASIATGSSFSKTRSSSLAATNTKGAGSQRDHKQHKAPTSSKTGSVYSKAGSSTSSAIGTGDDRTTIPSFWSIWTTRRMVRQLTSRLRNRRRLGESDRATTVGVEPTYRLEPHRIFNSSQVEKVIGDVLEAHLHDFTYNAKRCNMLARIIGEEIKDRVKALKFDRYKIVCTVTMGEKRSQDLRVASRCVWDAKVDTSSTYNWENGSAFCSVTVYGIYHE